MFVHPWLEKKEASANQVLVEGEDHIFGFHPDDSLECISESDTSLTQQSSSGHACHVSVSGSLSTEDDEDVPDAPVRRRRKFPKDSFPAIWRQSRQGRQRTKDPPTAKTHGRILLHHYSMAAESVDNSVPAYNLLMSKKVPSKSVSNEMPPTKVLLDTGASISLMPAW